MVGQAEAAKIPERGNLKLPGRIPDRMDAGSSWLGLIESYEPVFPSTEVRVCR